MLGKDLAIESLPSPEAATKTTKVSWSAGYPSLSATYVKKKFNLAFMVNFWQTIEKKSEENISTQQTNIAKTEKFDLPITFRAGANYKFSDRKNFVLDLSTTNWDKNIDSTINSSYSIGTGYEYRSGGGQYDAYYKKLSYRTGIGYKRLNILDVDEYKWTGGLGLPLGKRGGSMDLAVELGHRRGSIKNDKVQESFVKLYVSLTGAGIWGQSSRRK